MCAWAPNARTGVNACAFTRSYVVTRHYRAPELLCAAAAYGTPVDVWAAGTSDRRLDLCMYGRQRLARVSSARARDSTTHIATLTAYPTADPGCVFGEILLRTPLFHGTSTREQLDLIISALGTPTPAVLRANACDAVVSYVERMAPVEGVPWAGACPPQ